MFFVFIKYLILVSKPRVLEKTSFLRGGLTGKHSTPCPYIPFIIEVYIMDAVDMIMKDDQFVGDKIGCCPICGEHFHLPIELALSNNRPDVYPCSNCGQLINCK